MEEMSDAELIEAHGRSGHTGHLDVLIRRHIGRTRAMIHNMVMNEADADELTQEVFLRAVGGLPSFRKGAAFSTWLYRIAMNTTHTFLKRRARNPVEHRDSPPESAAPSAGIAPEVLMAREEDARLTAALASLPPPLRSALLLTCVHGLSIREAATAENCLIPTFYWRIHRARQLLRARLAREEAP